MVHRTCCITQEAQLHALWWPRQVGWWGGSGGRVLYVHLRLIHIVQQNPKQHCKAIILQFKMIFKKNAILKNGPCKKKILKKERIRKSVFTIILSKCSPWDSPKYLWVQRIWVAAGAWPWVSLHQPPTKECCRVPRRWSDKTAPTSVSCRPRYHL